MNSFPSISECSDFGLSQYDNEIIAFSSHSGVHSTNKCNSSAHCDTCTCYTQMPINIDAVGTMRQVMKIPEYPTKNTLPKCAIRDITLHGDKMLETGIDGIKVYRDVPFNHYHSPVISKRVVKNEFTCEKRHLSEYKREDTETHTYLNFRNGLTEYEAVMKYSVENNITYSAQSFNPVMISFDVEAFHPTDKNVVPSHTNGGIISMICATFTQVGKPERFAMYILNQYKYDKTEIFEFIQERRNTLKLKDSSAFTLDVIECENQTIMSCQFLDDVKSCGTSIMYGFNSSATAQQDKVDSKGKIKRVSVGYDLPFIIHNSARYTKESIEYGAKLFGKIGKQIKQIHWLPDTYIIDCMVVFQNDRYFATKLSEMPNNKLNSFLEQAKIPLKEDDKNIYERMDQMRIKGSDQTDCINYCAWDAYALTQVLNIIKFVDTIKANCEIFNVPLSWALHKNATSWCTMLMLRRFYSAGYAFSYGKYPMPEKREKFRGATTEICPENLIQQVLNNIAMWDFQSLYPNAIIAGNLGIDSIRDYDDGNCYAVNLNFVDPYLIDAVKAKIQQGTQKITTKDTELIQASECPNIVYFSKDTSLYATIVAEVLQKRLDVKASMKGTSGQVYDQLDARQNALKIFVNTIYGLSGACTFQLCDERVASACTAISRKLTYFARQSVEQLQIGNVVFRDTDSCAVMVTDETIKNIYKQSDKLNNLVNEKLQQDLGTSHIVKFVLEGENFQEKTYYPNAKKAYARVECNLNDIINNRPITRDIKIKGVSWSLMSAYGKEFFKYHTQHILMNFTDYITIKQYVDNVIAQVSQDIKTLINTKNFSEIARKYHKQIKNSQKNKTAQYLRKQFKVTDNEIQILPIVKASKLKSNCVVPCKFADKYTIDQVQLLAWFISPFVKFYGKHDTDESDDDCDPFETMIECRLATSANYMKKTRKYRPDELCEYLDNKTISYNEIVKDENKLFFDIDNAYNELNFQKCLDEIQKMICKFRHQSINVEYSFTKSTSKDKPHSYHLVYQIRSSLAMNKYIAQQVNQQIGFEIIDEALYSRGKSLRLPNTPKYDEKAKTLVHIYHNVIYGTLEQMYVTDLDNVTNSLSSAIGFIDKRHKELGHQDINMTEEYKNAIMSYIPFAVTFKEQNRGTMQIEPVQMPYNCPVCKRTHQSLKLVAYLRNDGFTLNCWSTKNKEKTPIKHTFEKTTKQTNKQSRIKQLQQYADIVTEYEFKRLNPANVQFQHNEQVQYDLSAQTTFVRSQMMTGKTKQQVQLTQTDEYKTILALSFRRTFARDNAEKNKFVNYENIEGEINMIDYPNLILQVDSLARLNTAVKPQLLIIDEIESTLEQLLAIKRDTSPYIIYKFIELLQSAEKVLCLDAELEQSTIEVISQLIGTDNYRVYVNTYKPKTDSKIYVHDYVSNSNADMTRITNQITELIDQGKKVVIFCTSREKAFTLKSLLPNDKCIKYYDGEDAIKYDGVSMAEIKRNDFKNVNDSWSDCNVLIYTGTLTAGISFELERFDTFIGIFARNTSTALAFTQGLHRVRNFADKVGHLYLEKEGSYLPETAYQITDTQQQIYGYTDLSEISQFKNWIESATNQSNNHRLQIVIRNLKNMGYNLEICTDKAQDKSHINYTEMLREMDIEAIAMAQITLEDITEIPRIMKATRLIIKNNDDQLHPKYMKVKIFRSYHPKPYTQEQIDRINSFNAEQIGKLYAERRRIAENNKIKNVVDKCLNTRPEFKDLEITQIQSLIDACQLEAKHNILAQFQGTAQKDQVIKCHQQIYIVKQAIKVRDTMTDLEPSTLETALKIATEDKTLKAIGFKFGRAGVNHKLNEILKYIDVKIDVADAKRVQINGKRQRVSAYKLVSISAESILASLSE